MGKRQISDDEKEAQRVIDELGNLKYKDLKAEVILRGMGFEEVVKGDHNTLASFFIKYHSEKKVPDRLNQFEAWVDSKLGELGHKPNDPIRKYKQFSSTDEEEITPKLEKPKKEKIEKPKKEKREKDAQFNIFRGTKKEYTYNLCHDLHGKFSKKYDHKTIIKKFSNQLFNKVQAKFPEAQEKSIKIWMSRCLASLK